MFNYDFVKETLALIIQFFVLMGMIWPFLIKPWRLIKQFFKDHNNIKEGFETITSDIGEVKDEFHKLNAAFREYSERTDQRLIRLETLNGSH